MSFRRFGRQVPKAVALLALIGAPLAAGSGVTGARVPAPHTAAPQVTADPYDFNAPDAVAYDGSHIWVTNSGENTVEELDAATGDVIQTLSGGKYDFANPDAIVFDGQNIWVVNSAVSAGSVTELKASTGAWIRTLSTNFDFSESDGIAFDGTDIWVTSPPDNLVTQVNASNGALVRELSTDNYNFNEPSEVAYDGSNIWITSPAGNTVTEVNPSTGAPSAFLSNFACCQDSLDNPYGVLAADGDLWVSDSNPEDSAVKQFNPSTGALLQTLSGGSYGFDGPIDMAADDGHIWVANQNGNSVTELDGTTGAWIRTLSGGSYGFDHPDALVSDGTNIWVTNSFGNSVTELSAATGAWVQTLYANAVSPTISGTPPTGIAADSSYDFSFTLGGNPPPTTTVTSGQLPPGLTLSAGGTISGVPTTAGTYPAVVTATNGFAPDGTENISITVTPVRPTVTVDPATAPAGAPVDVTGAGFQPGEEVAVQYHAPAPISLCATDAADDGSFACSGTLPVVADAGPTGSHTVYAIGATSGDTASTDVTLVTKAATVAVSPSKNLVGNTTVRLSGHHFAPGSPVEINLCSDDPVSDPGSCLQEGQATPTKAGSWSNAEEPLVGASPALCDTQCFVQAVQGGTDLVKTLTETTPSVQIVPGTDDSYYLNQKVTIQVKGFPAGDPVTVAICSNSISNCDGTMSATVTKHGDATFKRYFMDSEVCAMNSSSCFVWVTDSAYSNGPVTAFETFTPYCGPSCGGFGDRR